MEAWDFLTFSGSVHKLVRQQRNGAKIGGGREHLDPKLIVANVARLIERAKMTGKKDDDVTLHSRNVSRWQVAPHI